jgi:hypothetical protein
MAIATATQPAEELGPIPETPEPWRPGKKKTGKESTRFGVQESDAEQRQAFMEHTASLTPDDWQRSLIYVYQWAPSVDLTRGGRDPKYRKIYTRHMSEEDIKRDLGSGTYELKFNQLDPKGREKTVDRLVVNIMDYDFPPNLPPGPWLDDPKNADWAWARPALEKKFNKPSTNGAAPTGPTWNEMVQFLREEQRRPEPGASAKEQLMTSVVTILPALLAQSNNANDPTKIVEAMKTMKDMIAPPATASSEQNTLITFLLDEVKSMRQTTNDLMTRLIDMKTEATKQPSPMDQVKTMAELITTVSGIVQPAAPQEPWQQVVTELGPKVLDTANQAIHFFGARAMASHSPRPAITNGPPQPQPATASVPTPAQPTAPQPSQPEEQPMDTMQRSMLVNVAALAAQALNLGLEGDHFAEQICRKFGDMTYESFLKQVPKDQLLPQLKAIPEAWAMLQPFENLLPEFIDSFYAFDAEPEDQTNSISLPSEPVKNGKPKGKKK